MKKKTAYDVPTILVTTDYGMFKRLEGNREVTKKRSAKIQKSIKKVGYIPVPIVVNEHMQIIDGQGRAEAAKALGLPIYYMIVPGLGLAHCVLMNITSTSWTTIDYVSSYAEIGNDNYKRLLELKMSHNELPISVVTCAATGVIATTNPSIKTGTLILSEEMADSVDAMLAYVELFVPVCKEHKDTIGNPTSIYNALCFCYQHDEIDNDRMLDAFTRYWHLARSTSKVADVLGFLEDMYNRKRKKGKVYITTEYRKYMDGKYPWYGSRYGGEK